MHKSKHNCKLVANLLKYRILFKDMIIEMLKTLYLVVIGIDISKSNEEDNYNIQKFSAKKVNVLKGRTDFLVTMIELLRFLKRTLVD